MDRPKITEEELHKGVEAFAKKLRARLEEKKYQSMASRDEILGVLEREIHGLRMAVRSEDNAKVRDELLNVGVGAIFGALSVAFNHTEY